MIYSTILSKLKVIAEAHNSVAIGNVVELGDPEFMDSHIRNLSGKIVIIGDPNSNYGGNDSQGYEHITIVFAVIDTAAIGNWATIKTVRDACKNIGEDICRAIRINAVPFVDHGSQRFTYFEMAETESQVISNIFDDKTGYEFSIKLREPFSFAYDASKFTF
ncbi:MAG: hypothetical protein KA954_10605 [Chitinophagales bacterium]|nr:hypothetical protein [Chitinophagales bacterium]MBP8754182.1 hypothetical protein [Chitinophagales bacterium]MBP9704660.1 hypothetical protein [Chitinophagales bacterium]